MARLRDIAAGKRAIKRVRMQLCNVPCDLLPDVPELAEQRAADRAVHEAAKAAQPEQAPPFAPDATVEVGLRVLTGEEISLIYEKASAYARARGSTKPDESDPIYNLAVSVYTCAVACVDPDSDPRDPLPFFGEKGDVESGAKEVLSHDHLGRDGIVYLAEQHEHWQDQCNPQALKLGVNKLWQLVGEVAASNDAGPFLKLRPALRWTFTRFMACQLVTLLDHKLLSGLSFDDAGATNTSPDKSSES